jgi:hypothetical protein
VPVTAASGSTAAVTAHYDPLTGQSLAVSFETVASFTPAEIEPLAQAFFLDAVESDDALRFRGRGRTPSATIPGELLLAQDGQAGESWRERCTQEVELPERLGVVYMDPDADYQQGSQAAKRTSLPLPTMRARRQASLQPAMALAGTTAKRIAERTLISAWLGRSSYAAALLPDWLRLEPTDVVDLVFPSGRQFRMRLARVDVGADFSRRLEGVSETVARLCLHRPGRRRLRPAGAAHCRGRRDPAWRWRRDPGPGHNRHARGVGRGRFQRTDRQPSAGSGAQRAGGNATASGATTGGCDRYGLSPPAGASPPSYCWRHSHGRMNLPRHIPRPAILAFACRGSYSGRGNRSLPGRQVVLRDFITFSEGVPFVALSKQLV